MRRGPNASTVAAGLWAVLVLASVGWPLMAVAWRARDSGPHTTDTEWTVEWRLLASSVGIALLIATLATGLAIPAAWLSRRVSVRWLALLLAPMLLPNYLAYTGWSELRAGNTWLARWLMTGPPDAQNVKPVVAAWVCAVAGLALWVWPIAAVVMATGLRRIDESTLESLRLEPASWARRSRTLLNMSRPSMVAALAAVTLVMLGSAVPLHVAQLDTYAIALWRQLDLTPPGEQWRVWAGAWPLAVGAITAGLWVSRRTLGPGEEGDGPGGRRRPAVSAVTASAAIVVWGLSVVVPVSLLASNIGDPWFVRAFWRTAGAAVTASGLIAAAAGLIGAVVAAATWAGLSGSNALSERVTRAAAVALLIAGLTPGVLVGVTSATAWNALGLDSAVAGAGAIVLAHIARLGLVGVLVGAWAFRSQPRDERRLIALDGADTPVGWWNAALAAQPGPVIGAGLVVGLLSFHEIEAAVMLQPPGLDSFSRHMLQLLHYARYQDLSEAVAAVTGIGVLIGSVIVGVAGWVRR